MYFVCAVQAKHQVLNIDADHAWRGFLVGQQSKRPKREVMLPPFVKELGTTALFRYEATRKATCASFRD